MECGDVIYRSSLSNQDGFAPTVGGILLVTLLAAYLWSTPGVVPGIWDMFVLSPLERFLRKPIAKVKKRYSLNAPSQANSPHVDLVVAIHNQFSM